MEALLSRLTARAAPTLTIRRLPSNTWPTWVCHDCRVQPRNNHATRVQRGFTTSDPRRLREKQSTDPSSNNLQDSSYSQSAANLSHNVTQAERDHFDKTEEDSKAKQMKSPWMREGSAMPPVSRPRSAGAMTKGKLLTTPSRMLKLILPLTTRDKNKDRKDVEPLALLVHPQQPLSYLERLIQSELPMIEEHGKEKPPSITFRAEDSTEEDIGSSKSAVDTAVEGEDKTKRDDLEKADEMIVDGKRERTGKIKSSAPDPTDKVDDIDDSLPTHGHGKDDPHVHKVVEDLEHQNFVRWSPSTEIGDFIRDAARGKEFAVDIEGASAPIYVGVPSFNDRTYYLRMRLRKTARRISDLADIKKECDELAHKGAKRVAQGGFAALIAWWGAVYYLTFKTDLGWDVMEPVTYLVGLTGLIGGYMWFLYHNREVSYKSAMNFTVSRRQSQLYEQKGFNVVQWEGLVEEGNRLRREIKMVAEEYDVEWDESRDEGDEKVKEALRKARKKNGEKEEKKTDDEDEDDD
ncbi:hypothetical protein EJ03DRAFT_195338 [Teratosphaeria nubilosa]|uniref:Calcium uniporter protein, mitochondrial n=1 Tax=Teratosphaeria nubilosa TaxID=161662 RepID=A0A6G1KYU3_9PEZI|nr:hypothetical protein EJ03DRAFT_195338 [Teratosphaeria nubilosa]